MDSKLDHSAYPLPIQTALNKLPAVLQKNLTRNLCVCNDVPKLTIIETIVNGAQTVDAVRARTYATEGNGCCLKQVERLVELLAPKDLANAEHPPTMTNAN